jgi:RNA methyltransferase, TrmH family
MNNAFMITSSQNPKIKQLIKLRDKRGREKDQQFLIEGYREILRAHEAGYPIESLFFCEKLFLGSNEKALIAQIARHASIYELPEALFEKCSYRDRPDGLLAIAPIHRKDMESFLKSVKRRAGNKSLFLLLAESIEKPGNLGSILRSCDAAGVHGVLVCDKQADVFNPNVVRASIGTLFTIPVIECDVKGALAVLKDLDIRLVAATPHAKEFFTEVDFKQSIAIAMGTEQLGLSKLLMDQADIQVKIPMFGVADSLNVAAATTLMLYEVVRQRQI